MGTTSKQKNKRHATVDVVIILLLAVAVVGIFFRWVFETTLEDRDRGGKTYIVSMEIDEAHYTTLDSLRAADSLYLVESDTYLGYFTSDPTVVRRLENGELPNRAIATARMSCLGRMADDGTLTVSGSGLCLTPGSTVEVRTERALLTLRVVRIDAKN